MHRIGISKQIVHITQNLLISTNQKHTYIISVFSFQRMYRQVMRYITGRDKIGNLSIRITSNILQGSISVGLLVQTLDRHDREYLIYRPRVRQRLEQREITKIFISQQFVQFAELIGRMFQPRSNLIDLTGHRPVQTLYLGTGLQIHNTVAE